MGKLYILIEVCPPHRGLTPRSLKMGDTKMQHAKMSHDEAKRLDEIVTGLRTKRVKDIMPTEDITLVANTYRVPKRILGRTEHRIV